MPITVNEGGVLHELETVTSNEGGVLYELDTVHENEGGVLYEIFGADKPIWKCTSISYSGATASNVLYSGMHGSSNRFSGNASNLGTLYGIEFTVNASYEYFNIGGSGSIKPTLTIDVKSFTTGSALKISKTGGSTITPGASGVMALCNVTVDGVKYSGLNTYGYCSEIIVPLTRGKVCSVYLEFQTTESSPGVRVSVS